MIDLTKPERDIVIFDLETTGLSTSTDRIVSIALVKMNKDLKFTKKYYQVVNPEMDIPEEATSVHGISNEDVFDKPKFADIAKEVIAFTEGCDLCGFNSNKFDVPLLSSEFYRVGILGWPAGTQRTFDAMVIFKQAFPSNLEGAYKRYMNKDIKRQEHNALEDTMFTAEVFRKQLQVHQKDLRFESWNGFERFNHYEKKFIDIDQKFYLSNGNVYYAFGKHTDKKLKDNVRYFIDFMANNDFHKDTMIKGCMVLENKLNQYMAGKLSQQEIRDICGKHITL